MTRLILAMCFLLSFSVPAQQPPPARVRLAELAQHPIGSGSARITFVELRPSGILKVGVGWLRVEVENDSTEPLIFNPGRFYFVGKDGIQASLLGMAIGQEVICATERMIGPHARMRAFYTLSDKLHLPADFYYDGKWAATILD